MQGWGWSTDEEPSTARAVLPHSAGRLCAMVLGSYVAIAAASISLCMVWSVLECASKQVNKEFDLCCVHCT